MKPTEADIWRLIHLVKAMHDEHVVGTRIVECVGGPRDGELPRIDSVQCDRGGCYVPLSESLAPGKYWVRELRWVPDQ